jgi:hypothetical protein
MEKCALSGLFEDCEGVANSKEHIIPNFLGGRKKAICICTSCNNKAGEEWDAELAKQLAILCILFCTTRERGDNPTQSLTNFDGKQFLFSSDGRIKAKIPSYAVNDIDTSKVQIQIEANSEKDAKKMIAGLLRKHKLSSDFENYSYATNIVPLELKTEFSFDVSGPKAGRSLVKSVYLFGISSGLNRDLFSFAWDYLSKTPKPAPQCFGPYYNSDLIKNRPTDIPLHAIAIKGCTNEKILFGYIELFGLIRFLVKLSSNYLGDNIQFQHVINPITGEELNLEIILDISQNELNETLNPTEATAKKCNDIVSTFMPRFIKIWQDLGRENIVAWAKDKALKDIGPLSEENLENYISEVWKNIFSLNVFELGIE